MGTFGLFTHTRITRSHHLSSISNGLHAALGLEGLRNIIGDREQAGRRAYLFCKHPSRGHSNTESLCPAVDGSQKYDGSRKRGRDSVNTRPGDVKAWLPPDRGQGCLRWYFVRFKDGLQSSHGRWLLL